MISQVRVFPEIGLLLGISFQLCIPFRKHFDF